MHAFKGLDDSSELPQEASTTTPDVAQGAPRGGADTCASSTQAALADPLVMLNHADFLARLGHELRTPLHGVLGMTDVAIRTLHEMAAQASPLAPGTHPRHGETPPPGGLDPLDTLQPILQMVRQSAISMLNILNDLMDISKVESGSLKLEEHPMDLAAQVREAMAPLAKVARDKGLAFLLEVDPTLPAELLGDSARLRQVFRNLVENAIKFTHSGSIEVRLRALKPKRGSESSHAPNAAPASHAKGRMQFLATVKDTGVGVAEEHLPRLFESFYQVDGTLSRAYEGTGMGLAITRHLVKMMGGDIWVRSKPGEGSTFTWTFWLALPAPEAGQNHAQEPGRQPLPSLRILLAEDNLVNQAFAQLILKREGHKVTTASNGHDALALLSKDVFDLVLMDVRMPGMDGVETTRRIRARDNGILDPDVPIIAMTAHSQRGDRERFLEAGMDDYISKPMAWESVIDIIGAVLEKRGRL